MSEEKSRLPANEQAFARLRAEARRTAGRDPASGNVTEWPRVTPAAVPAPKAGNSNSEDRAATRPTIATAEASSVKVDRGEPARAEEKGRPAKGPELASTSEPNPGLVDEDQDIQELFFGRRKTK